MHVMVMILCVGEDNESPVLRLPVSSTEKMTSCVALKQIACSHDQKHGTVLTCPCELFLVFLYILSVSTVCAQCSCQSVCPYLCKATCVLRCLCAYQP